ncbi:MAG: hypothetical protein IKR48_10140 [Kiritimatiellae bacterium]|nr:hypothetical protein [Kiritimatiellia bacterium]
MRKFEIGLWAVIWSISAYGITLENDAMRICFADADEGFACTGIVNLAANGARFVSSHPDLPDFWRLQFADITTKGKAVAILNNHSPVRRRRVETEGATTVFVWEGMDLPGEPDVVDVRASVMMSPGNGESLWTISVQNRSQKRALYHTIYPILSAVVPDGKGDVLVPHSNLGARLERKRSGAQKRSFAHMGYHPMVTAFHLGDAGLYVAAHDPESRIKNLELSGDQTVCFSTLVENAGVVGKAADGPKYPVAVAAYRGDWWQAARRYRSWALRQFWTAKGPIATRTDYPKTMAETPLWINIHGYPPTVSNLMTTARSVFPSIRTGLHWHLWQHSGHDVNYPEYFPEQPGTKETLTFCNGIGQLVMPYINGRLFDSLLQGFAYAEPYACQTENGTPYMERYGNKRPLVPMCPFTKEWSRTVNDLANRISGELDAKALFIDQIGAAAPRPCFNPTHGHPLGGGTYWAEGYQRMLRQVHDTYAARGACVTTEGTAETWMNVVDGYLVVTLRTGEDVPFYPAVYSGYTTYFCSPQNLTDTDAAFFAMQAREFLWGCELGWYDASIVNPKNAVKQRMVNRLCRARMELKEFLAYGTLLDELRVIGEQPELSFLWTGRWHAKDQNVRLPAVIGALWQSAHDGKRALVAVNLSDQPQRVRIALPDGQFRIRTLEGEAESTWKQTGNEGEWMLPSGTICALTE